jgi:hypothetical protein
MLSRHLMPLGVLFLLLVLAGCSKPEEPVAVPPVSAGAAGAPVAGKDAQAPTDALGPRTAGAPGNEQPPPGLK